MLKNQKPIYNCILLKISGEALQGSESFGIDANILKKISHEIKEITELNVKIGIVIGGGNILRGAKLENIGISRIVGDYMGMLSTTINGLAMCDYLNRISVDAKLISAIPLNGISSYYNCMDSIKLVNSGKVLIFSSGTGNPFFTTDLAACLRAIEIKADIILKATKVDGVYSSDPLKYLDAIFYKKLNYEDVLSKRLKIMDLAALIIARDYKLPIRVFNMNKIGALRKIVMGGNEGTILTSH
ncbi:MAG: UMP kinase [Arsenophonus sp.]|nr:MAG: UMP kinase [Arsenophonus sp.]